MKCERGGGEKRSKDLKKKARKVSDFVIEESYISSSRSREVVVVEKAALFVPIALLVYIALHSLACLSFGGGGAGWTSQPWLYG